MNNADFNERVHRLQKVLQLFDLLDRNVAEEIADAAIEWTTATLAFHAERATCEAFFFAYIDCIYAETDDAEARFSKTERGQMYERARVFGHDTQSLLPDIVRASLKILCELGKDHLFALLAQSLQFCRTDYLPHAWLILVRSVVTNCAILCNNLESLAAGKTTKDIVDNSLQELHVTLSKVQKSIFQDVEAGRLQVRDGKIFAN